MKTIVNNLHTNKPHKTD